MNKLYNLADVLPIYVLENGIPKLINDLSESEVDFDFIPDWVIENNKIGQLGEYIVKKYLEDEYSKVDQVSIYDSAAGYDIICEDFFCYEVKTTTGSDVMFHVTKNELEVADQKRGIYNIVFVTINERERKVSGHIINDPINFFELNVKELFKINSNEDRCKLEICNIRISTNNIVIYECYTIDLTKYWLQAVQNEML